MKYIDRLIEATADWFMDFFLDTTYVVETSNGWVEALLVSGAAVTFATEITAIEPEVCVSIENEEKALTPVPVLNTLAIAVMMQIKKITVTVQNYINDNKVFEKLVNFVIQTLLQPLRFSKYLTG